MARGAIKYSLSETFAVVKLVERITWEASVELNTLFACLLKDLHISVLYLDCSETSYVDSTILGTIVHFKKKSDTHNLNVIICSPSKACETILTDVGLNKVFQIVTDLSPVMEITKELPLGKQIPPSEIEKLIKNAHEELMKLNKKNRNMFAQVVNTFKKSN
jgi:anti-anti-sigma factor